jgi:hypothetical protein
VAKLSCKKQTLGPERTGYALERLTKYRERVRPWESAKYRLASTLTLNPATLSSTMSEKLQEFIEVPQQFVRDGRQACLNIFHVAFYENYLFAVHDPLHQANRKRSAAFELL